MADNRSILFDPHITAGNLLNFAALVIAGIVFVVQLAGTDATLQEQMRTADEYRRDQQEVISSLEDDKATLEARVSVLEQFINDNRTIGTRLATVEATIKSMDATLRSIDGRLERLIETRAPTPHTSGSEP